MTNPKSDLDGLAAWEQGGFDPTPTQPRPQPAEGSRPVWPALETDLAALPRTLVPDNLLARLAGRVAQGRAKYGVELHTLDGRDPWLDLEEEILDAFFYACRLYMLGALVGWQYLRVVTHLCKIWTTLQDAKARQGAKP